MAERTILSMMSSAVSSVTVCDSSLAAAQVVRPEHKSNISISKSNNT